MNEEDHYDIVATRRGGRAEVRGVLHLGLMTVPGKTLDLPCGPVALGIDGTPDSYRLLASAAGAEPAIVAEGVARYLSTEVTGGFTGVYLALFSEAAPDGASNFARFSW